MTDWEVKGVSFGNCNCVYACPCQFNALPDKGSCEAVVAYRIDSGHFGDVRLDGLKAGLILWWPGPVHEGGGKFQPIIDTRADAAQRKALLTIMTGGETEEFATMWFVYHAMCDTVFEPVYAEIEFDVDVNARRGRVAVENVMELTGEPIRNPVTGAEHSVRIDMPHGFEYAIAEIGSASSKTRGKIALELKDSYGQFNLMHLTGKGVVRPAAQAA